MAGQNGYLTSSFDGTIPNQQFGEAVGEADLVGFKDDADGRRVVFKALAAAGATQVKAVGVCPRAVGIGGYEAIRANTWRVALPKPLPAALTGLQPGDEVYLSDTVAGGMTKTAPVGAGKIKQVVGYGYWTGNRPTGMDPTEDANGVIIDIQPAVTL